MNIQRCLFVMKNAARKAGAIALNMRTGIKDIGKIDKQFNNENSILHGNKTALTIADLECQKIIMKTLLKSFNFCGVYAEENNEEMASFESQFSHSGKLEKNKYTFLIDPIDGTRNYIEKNSINSDKYGVLISLAYGFEIVAGAVFYPEQNILIHAAKNMGVFINNKRCHLTKKRNFSFNDPISVSPSISYDFPQFTQKKVYRSCCYNILAFIKGEIQAYCVSKIPLLDFGFLGLAIKEGGGFIGSINSEPVDIRDLIVTRNKELFLEGFIILSVTRNHYQEIILSMNIEKLYESY